MPPCGGVNTCKDDSGVGVEGSEGVGGLTCDGIAGNGDGMEWMDSFPGSPMILQ